MFKPIIAIAAIAAAVLSCCIRADAMTLVRLEAKRVTFYYNRFLVEADGDVRVTTSDGMTMTGDAFSMDLKLNRFLLAGHVHMQDSDGAQDGAALADFLDFNRIYFVPITSEPDRWTFINGDFAHPAKGREMPGDTFYFPDLGNDKPYLIAQNATIGTKSFIRFGGNHMDMAGGLGAYVPTPSYYVNFSSDPHLGDNSLAGANYDATWNFAGGANAISALHFRYDTVNQTYLSFEQHLSGSKAYAVFSVNPMTRPQKFWDLVLSDKPSDKLQFRTFTQLATYQHGLTQPDASSQFTIFQATQALPKSFLQLYAQDTNFSLLPPGDYHGVEPIIDHPYQMQLTAQSFDHRISHLPLYEHLSYGFGYIHDSKGLQDIGGTLYTSIWNHDLDFLTYVPSLRLGNSPLVVKNYYFNASFEKNRTWYSSPHHTDTATTRMSLSKTFNSHFVSYLAYSIENVGDYYSGTLQSSYYPPFTPVVNGVPYPGYEAFKGVATFRALSLDVTYQNQGYVAASLLATKHDDFPTPIPNYFQPPPLDILGRPLVGEFYLGEPPYEITGDVRVRVNSQMSIDISRSYYFNFGHQDWSPKFVIQVSQ